MLASVLSSPQPPQIKENLFPFRSLSPPSEFRSTMYQVEKIFLDFMGAPPSRCQTPIEVWEELMVMTGSPDVYFDGLEESTDHWKEQFMQLARDLKSNFSIETYLAANDVLWEVEYGDVYHRICDLEEYKNLLSLVNELNIKRCLISVTTYNRHLNTGIDSVIKCTSTDKEKSIALSRLKRAVKKVEKYINPGITIKKLEAIKTALSVKGIDQIIDAAEKKFFLEKAATSIDMFKNAKTLEEWQAAQKLTDSIRECVAMGSAALAQDLKGDPTILELYKNAKEKFEKKGL